MIQRLDTATPQHFMPHHIAEKVVEEAIKHDPEWTYKAEQRGIYSVVGIWDEEGVFVGYL